MFQIVSSVREPTFQFYDNLYYLKNGVSNGEIHFQGHVSTYTPDTFVYDNKRRIFDFVRSAQPEVRDVMAGDIHFQGGVRSYTPNTFVYDNKRCVYDFTRTAKAKVRNDMASVLCGPGWLSSLPNARSREAFDCLFDYHHYKGYLEEVGNQRAESMNMLIFKEPLGVERGYVALVKFKSVSRRNRDRQYTVNATLTCQRFSYFELQESTLDELLEKLQDLKVAE